MTTTDDRASGAVYRILFKEPADMEAVEGILHLAIHSVECLHGEAAVRLEAGYAIYAHERLVVLVAGAPMAMAVARVFVGMCSREFGERAFRILRDEEMSNPGRRSHTNPDDEVLPS